MPEEIQTVKQRYERFVTDRQPFLDRAYQCSELTIPTLIPPLGHNSSTKYYTPWQGIGARGVNNLASKLLLGLFPVNTPFVRLTIDDFTLAELTQSPGNRSKIEEGFNKMERAISGEYEGTGMRAPCFTTLKHLIVSGNALQYLPADGGVRVFGLDQFVTRRDPKGNLLEAIIKECVDPVTLEEDLQELLEEDPEVKPEKKDHSHDVIEVYTRFYRDAKRWRMHQEIAGKRVPGSDGSWPVAKPPILALRWTAVEGEDYGRGYVEEYLGDLISLEGLSRSIVEATAAVSKIVFLVNPNGLTRVKDIAEAESGDFVDGVESDIHCLQADKQADLRIASETIKSLTDRLSYAFLMTSAVQRNGERVTAEEIRTMVNDLESALGGVYSVLSQEFQLPLVIRMMDRMQKQKRLPPLPEGVITPKIVTGLEAIGRGQDLQKYQALMQFLAPLGPEVLGSEFNLGDLITRAGTALMIDMDGLVKSPEQKAQEAQQQAQMMQQQMMQELAGKIGPSAVKAMSDQSLAAGQTPEGTPQG